MPHVLGELPAVYNVGMTQEESFVFISYTGVDEPWATWIASILEGAGLAARVQVWDSPPGRNFVEWRVPTFVDSPNYAARSVCPSNSSSNSTGVR